MRTVFKYYKSYIPLIVGILAFPVSYTHLDVYKRQIYYHAE